MFGAVAQHVRFACRGLWHARAFTIAATAILAVGMAGTTIMFALVQGVLLRPLPVDDQDRLIIAWKELRTSSAVQYPFGDTEIKAVADMSRSIARAAGVTRNGVGRTALIEGAAASYANVADVTGGFFDVLGVRPTLGRALAVADDKEGAEHVVVITDGFWRRHYGASPDVIGRLVTLDDQKVRIVGVMPSDLDYPAGVEMWRTTTSVPTDGPFGDAVRREVNLIARLRPGVTVAQATSEIAALSGRLDAGTPANSVRGLVPVVRPFAAVVVGDVRQPLLYLFGAVALVLLVACANVANLLLMRLETRRGELALRAALGAGRAAIFAAMLAESVMVTLIAAALGLVIAWWSLDALVMRVPNGLPRIDSIRIDATVVAFSALLAFVTAALAGLAPAFLSTRADLASQLRAAHRGLAGSRAGVRGRRMLVVAQMALAVTVLAAAGLLLRSAAALQSVDLGLTAERLLLVELYVPQPRLDDRARHAQFLRDVITRLEATPAIAAATPVNVPPFSGEGWDLPRFTAEGQDADASFRNPSLDIESIHPNYFDTLQVPIRRGRSFMPSDREGAEPVAIISADLASRLWPGEDPIGKRLKMGGPDSRDPGYRIVGVAGPTRYREPEEVRPTLYLPAAQFQMTATLIVLRTTAPLELVTSLVRAQLQTIDRTVHVMRIEPFAQLLDGPLARPRFTAFLLGAFAVAALVLSTVGLYAVMGAYVRQRDREIAIRVALGATPVGIRRLVLAEAARLAVGGAVIGVAGAMVTGPLVRGWLFGVNPLDPAIVAAAALAMLGAAWLASSLPLRRAARIDAVAVLRSQ